MVGVVKFLIFANGNVQYGDQGVFYDRDPVKKIRVDTDSNYEQLIQKICKGIRIDRTAHRVEVFHRHPKYSKTVECRERYDLLPINDDDDVLNLIEMAEAMGEYYTQDLYIKTYDDGVMAPPEHETQHVDATAPPTSQVPQSMNDAAMAHKDDASPMHDQYDVRLSDDDDCVDLEVDSALQETCIVIDDEFENEKVEIEGPSQNTVIQTAQKPPASPMPSISPIDMHARDDVPNVPPSERSDIPSNDPMPISDVEGGSGHMPFNANGCMALNDWSFCAELKKRMKFNTKADLIHAVKMYHIMHRHNFRVDDSGKDLWSVFCAHRESGCKWRLRACKKQLEGVFVITKVEGLHTCPSLVLDQDHPQLDSGLMARYFLNYVRENPYVKVPFLCTVIADKFGYMVSKKKVWDAKRKAAEMAYGNCDTSNNELLKKFNAKRSRSSCRNQHMGLRRGCGRGQGHCLEQTLNESISAQSSPPPLQSPALPCDPSKI